MSAEQLEEVRARWAAATDSIGIMRAVPYARIDVTVLLAEIDRMTLDRDKLIVENARLMMENSVLDVAVGGVVAAARPAIEYQERERIAAQIDALREVDFVSDGYWNGLADAAQIARGDAR